MAASPSGACPHRVLQFFRSHTGKTEALLDLLRQRGAEAARGPGCGEVTLFRADSTPDLVASLHVFGEGPGWPDALNRLIVQASAMPQSGLVSRPSVLHALVTLWEREFEVASETAAIAELATHPSTSRLFADLLTPLALRGVGEFPMRSLRICQVRGDPGRFFVIAQLPSAVVRDAYLASSFRRDEVLPTIGPYLAADVRRYSLTPLWHSGRPGAG